MTRMACLTGGVRFDDQFRRCTVYDTNRAFGLLALGLGVFSAYILYFRPDIYKEANALVWMFRVIFPFGFGLAGLAMLGRSVRTVFDATRGTFVHSRTSLFRSVTRKGRFGEVTQIVLDARYEMGAGRMESDQGRMQWRLTLSMDLGGKQVPLRVWTHHLGGNRPPNEPVVKAKEASP